MKLAAGLAALSAAVTGLVVGQPAAATADRSIGTASHGPVVRPGQYNGDLRTAPRPPRDPLKEFMPPREREVPALPYVDKQPLPGAPTQAPATPTTASAPAPSASASFEGLDLTNWGAGWPPDPVGDVGPNNFVEAVNTSIGIFSKAGTQLAAMTFDTLWSQTGSEGALCNGNNGGDPTVVYDPMADRWIVADFAFTGNATAPPFYECIAVSKTSDPVAGGWWLYAVRTDDASHPWFPDYPKMGIWPNGLYMSANMFSTSSFQEVRLWAFNRSDLESGSPLRQVVVDLGTNSHFSLLPANLRGSAPPAGRDELFVAESIQAFAFEVFSLHVDYAGNTSTLTGPTDVSQSAYSFPAHLPLVPTPQNSVDSLTDRLMMQAQYRNFGGTESLWVTHTVLMGKGLPYGTQWAQLDVTGGTVATTPVQQQIYGNLNSDGVYRWMGSLAVDDKGDMALGYSAASSTLDPAVRYAGRLAGDPLGTLPQTETSLIEGGGSQSGNCGGSTCSRWGDYSAMSIDPSDGCTFWYVQEYYAADGLDWHTRIGSFAFPSCTGATASTSLVPQPASGTYGGTVSSLSATLTSGGNPVSGKTVTFALNGVTKGTAQTNASGVATLANVSLSGINAGSYSSGVQASFGGDGSLAPSSGTAALTVAKADQTITFTGAPTTAVYQSTFTVTATATSTLPVTVTSSGACTNTGTTVTMTSGTGTCSLTATQPGNQNYNAAPQQTQSTTAAKKAQSVALTVPSSKVATDQPFTVSGTATSGLPVALGIASGPCTISATTVSGTTASATVTITGAGTCTVTGDQGGDANWLAAPTATAGIAITKASQTIDFPPPGNKTFGDPDFTVTATASSGLPVTFSVLPTDPCTVSGDLVHITHAGVCHITASQGGDADYNSATPVERDVTIAPAPTSASLTLSTSKVQYSDRLTMTASIAPTSRTGQVNFTIAGHAVGSVAVVNGVATLTVAVNVAPASTSVGATYVSSNADFAGAGATSALTVTRENAAVAASGKTLAFTSSVTTSSVGVTLRALVTDAADASRGDIRYARVTFVNRATGGAFAGCRGLAVALLSSTDHTRGAASCTTSMSANATNGATSRVVGIVVGGRYLSNTARTDYVVTVSRPVAHRIDVGGGALTMRSSAGRFAATSGTSSPFGLVARYNSARTTLHGAVVVLFTHNGRVYRLQATSLRAVRGTVPGATVVATAVLTDVTNPSAPTVVARDVRLRLTMRDGGTSPSKDSLGVESRSSGGVLLFSSRWNGSATVRQALARGAILVR